MDYQNRMPSFIGSLMLVLIGLALMYAFSTIHAKASERIDGPPLLAKGLSEKGYVVK